MSSIWIKKTDDDKLFKFSLHSGSRLHKESTLAELNLKTLKRKDSEGDFVPVAFNNEGLSFDEFATYPKESPLVVTGVACDNTASTSAESDEPVIPEAVQQKVQQCMFAIPLEYSSAKDDSPITSPTEGPDGGGSSKRARQQGITTRSTAKALSSLRIPEHEKGEPQGQQDPLEDMEVAAAEAELSDEASSRGMLYYGCGTLYRQKGMAVSCNHNFSRDLEVNSVVEVFSPFFLTSHKMTIIKRNSRLDYIFLRMLEVPDTGFGSQFIEEYLGDISMTQLVGMCSYNLTLRAELHEMKRAPRLGISVGHITCLSNAERHVLYSSTSFEGDSGGVLVLRNGRGIAIHSESITSVRARLARKGASIGERMDDAELSLDSVLRHPKAEAYALLSKYMKHED